MKSTLPKLVAFDLDGTLAESKQLLGKDMGDLLGKLLEKLPIAVMSGGSYPQFQKQFLASIPSDARLERLYLFPTNASELYQYVEGAWHASYDLELSPEEKEAIRNALTHALASTEVERDITTTWGEQIEDRGSEISFSALGQQAPISEKEKWDPERRKRTSLQEALQPLLPDFTIRIGGMTTIDIVRKGITKAYGIQKLAQITAIPIREMLYVGDALYPGGNDEVVKETEIPTFQVSSVAETALKIKSILEALSTHESVTTQKRPHLKEAL
ncbi:MAG: HAD-IIB family hydrolase [Patescibacteria group bacterium]|nr:HAD-IIB family hydrolase [Patescibacteria group bacterium]